MFNYYYYYYVKLDSNLFDNGRNYFLSDFTDLPAELWIIRATFLRIGGLTVNTKNVNLLQWILFKF